MKNSLIFALSIVGTLIGAGFATGQELYSFFIMRSDFATVYFFLSTFIMLLVLTVIYFYCIKENLMTSEILYRSLFGNKLSIIFLFISTSFLFSCFCVTASGTGSLFEENLNLPYFVGVLTILVITYSTIKFDIEGIFFVNSIITPLIIISLFLIGIYSSFFGIETFVDFHSVKDSNFPFLYSLLYFGYNVFSVIPVVISANKKMNKKYVVSGIFIATVIILLSGVIIITSMEKYRLNLDDYTLPFLNIVSDVSDFAEKLYILIMYFAMITTAISCFFGYYKNISEYFKVNSNIIVVLGLLAAYAVSFFGFTELVRKVYSFFGIFGVIISICILCKIFYLCILKIYEKIIKN